MALRCLIVDDNGSFVASATRLLESRGMEVAGSASSSEQALELARVLSPDVLLVDVQLGEEDGLELARRLDVSFPAVPVVLVSTHGEEEVAELIADSPAVGFLPKRVLSADAIAALLSARRGT